MVRYVAGMAQGLHGKQSDMISVIMPAYNAGPYIGAAISSVLAQDHTDLELLVVDNNSTDGTLDIVRSFSDPRIRLLHQPVQGVSAARNKALEVMRGDHFCFMDADDAMPQDSISSRLAVLKLSPHTAFVDGIVQVKDASMKNTVTQWKPSYRGVPYEPLLRLSPICFFATTWLFRRQPGKAYRFDQRLTHAEDLLFLISVARDGRYDFVERTVLHYRKGHASAMNNLDGLHQGYRGLVRAVPNLPDPPPAETVDAMWDKIKYIMWRSYLKRGRPLSAWRAWREPRPAPFA